MNKKAAVLLLLFTMSTASALAPLAIALIGAGAGGILGGIFGYLLGVWTSDESAEYQKVFEDYADILNEQSKIDSQTSNITLEQYDLKMQMFKNMTFDFAKYSEAYLWTLAKYTYIKTLKNELANGSSWTEATNTALNASFEALDDWYNNTINTTNAKYNAEILVLQEIVEKGINDAVNDAQMEAMSLCVAVLGNGGYDTGTSSVYYLFDGAVEVKAGWGDNNDQQCVVSWVNVKVGGNTIFNANPSEAPSNWTIITNYTNLDTSKYGVVKYFYAPVTASGAGKGYFSFLDTFKNYYVETVDTIYNYKAQVYNNLAAYVSALNSSTVESINITDLLDPVTLATQINNDAENTGYYGFAAAEAALLGIPTNLNATICVEIENQNETVCGILLSDYNGTIELNNTYYADPTYLWYLIDENGIIHDISGENFTVTDLRDKEGNQLTNTTFIKYIDHSGDVQKLYEELEKLNELYNQYLEMQTINGGGSVGDWWANLSDTEKLAIGAAAVLLIILIARK